MCGEVIVVKANEDPNDIVYLHMSSIACSEAQQQQKLKREKQHPLKHKCAKCGKFDMVKATCSGCRQDFCLKHRFSRDHECRAQKFSGISVGPFIVSQNKKEISVKS